MPDNFGEWTCRHLRSSTVIQSWVYENDDYFRKYESRLPFVFQCGKIKTFFFCEVGCSYCNETEMLRFFKNWFCLENRYSVIVSLSYDINHGTAMGNKRTHAKSQGTWNVRYVGHWCAKEPQVHKEIVNWESANLQACSIKISRFFFFNARRWRHGHQF